MARIITLRRPDTCADCGAALPIGARARWYRNGAVYGLDCHEQKAPSERRRTGKGRFARSAYERGDTSPGAIASHYDRFGVYAPDGTKLGSSCGCIDYPCCGH
jgi:hypothetical protein